MKLITVLLLSASLWGSDLTDAPIVGHPAPKSSTWHELRVPLTAMWTTNAADMTQTCIALHDGAVERVLPTQNCAGVVAWLAGSRVALTASSYLLAKHGHVKLAKGVLWVAAGSSATGVTWSAAEFWHTRRHP